MKFLFWHSKQVNMSSGQKCKFPLSYQCNEWMLMYSVVQLEMAYPVGVEVRTLKKFLCRNTYISMWSYPVKKTFVYIGKGGIWFPVS